MKKLATLVVAVGSLAIAAPVFACPNMDHGAETAAPRTVEKDKAETPKAKDAPAASATKDKAADTKTAKPAAKPAEAKKPGDKVSQR